MTRLYAAQKLLALGPLELADFIEITGWPRKAARKTLAALVERGCIEYRGNTRKGFYEVAA
jgi:hypothetical protein